MADRLSLHNTLKKLFKSPNVYYQPPSSTKMSYPAIVYSKSKPNVRFANNNTYARKDSYELIVIDHNPDNEVIEKLQELPYCSWVRHYTKDNLNHDVLSLYY